MAGWPLIALPLALLCGGTALGLSLTPAGCRDTLNDGAVVVRAVGEAWVKPGCGQSTCQATTDGRFQIVCTAPPFPDCEAVPPESSAAPPDCCPEYRCPGRCFASSLQRWFKVGERWSMPGCNRATCTGTGSFGVLPCGLIAIQPGCKVTPGDKDAEYPGCCPKVNCEEQLCYDEKLDRHFAVGEKWTLPGCGQATCGKNGLMSAVICPLVNYIPGCSLDDGNLRLEYPQCCPKITCEACYSPRLDRYFGPGDVWTDSSCTQKRCEAGPNGAEVRQQPCGRLGLPPFPDCEVVTKNSSGEYPNCCPEYRCPDRCFSPSLERWFEKGDEWTETGCRRGSCLGTDMEAVLPCGLIGVTPGCQVVPGDQDSEYPGCCPKVECEEHPCHDRELNRHFAVGEKWTLSGCSGQATCGRGGLMKAVGCPLQATNTPGCGLDDGDLRLEYPQCCPKITCEACHSTQLDKYFGPGDTWTESSCIQKRCSAGPYGAEVQQQSCSALGELPFPDCEVIEDREGGDFPNCCAFHRCPGRCFHKGSWHAVGEQWDDGCIRAVCAGTGRVELLTCPLVRYDPSRSDCQLVEGDSSAAFPACCDRVQCDTPLDKCLDSEGRSRRIGATWTGPGCARSECQATEGGVTVVRRTSCPPPPSADCLLVEENPGQAEYPFCCPTYRCPGRCFSPIKDRWFSVGDEWTEDACILASCTSTSQINHEPCPFVSARRFGCSVVPGNITSDYPRCCPHVVCKANPYG